MSREYFSGVVPKKGDVIFGYEIVEIITVGSASILAKAKKGADEFFFKKFRKPTADSPWFNQYVAYQEEIKKRIEQDPELEDACVRPFEFFQMVKPGSGGRSRAYYQTFEWLGHRASLRDVLTYLQKNPRCVNASAKIKMALILIKNIKKLHEAEIVHSDLKPENLMLTSDDGDFPTLRFSDLDFSLIDGIAPPWITPGGGGFFGTPGYLSPEHLRNLRPQKQSDLFTCGLILAEIFTGKHPSGQEKEKFPDNALQGKLRSPKIAVSIASGLKNPELLQQTINGLLHPEIEKRPSYKTIEQALEPAEGVKKQRPLLHGLWAHGEDSDFGTRLPAGDVETLKDSDSSSSPAGSAELAPSSSERKGPNKKGMLIVCMAGFFLFLLYLAGKDNTSVSSDLKSTTPPPNPTPAYVSQEPASKAPEIHTARINTLGVGAFKNINFDLVGYVLQGSHLLRTVLRTSAQGDLIQNSPLISYRLNHFRLWAKHICRVAVNWNGYLLQPGGPYRIQGIDYNFLFNNFDGGPPGYIGSNLNGGVSTDPYIKDLFFASSTRAEYTISVFYDGIPIQNVWEQQPTGILNGKRYYIEGEGAAFSGSDFEIIIPSDSDMQIRLNEGPWLSWQNFQNMVRDEGLTFIDIKTGE